MPSLSNTLSISELIAVKHFTNINGLLNNIFIISPLIFFTSWLIGIVFYRFVNNWDWPTTVYYSAQVLLGPMYGTPVENSWLSKFFTLFLFIWGTILLAGAVGIFASTVVENVIKSERSKIKLMAPYDYDGDGVVGSFDVAYYHYERSLDFIGWQQHKLKYITLLLTCSWLAFGTIAGHYYFGYTWLEGLYFSLGAVSSSGLPTPDCVPNINSLSTGILQQHQSRLSPPPSLIANEPPPGSEYGLLGRGAPDNGETDCSIPTIQAVFITLYILIGVPLFTLTLGQFSLTLIERAVRAQEYAAMQQPLTEEEYLFAIELKYKRIGSESARRSRRAYRIDLAEFIVMEMLRLKRINHEDIDEMRLIFNEIDYDESGYIDREKLQRLNHLNQNLNDAYVSTESAWDEPAPAATPRQGLPAIDYGSIKTNSSIATKDGAFFGGNFTSRDKESVSTNEVEPEIKSNRHNSESETSFSAISALSASSKFKHGFPYLQQQHQQQQQSTLSPYLQHYQQQFQNQSLLHLEHHSDDDIVDITATENTPLIATRPSKSTIHSSFDEDESRDKLRPLRTARRAMSNLTGSPHSDIPSISSLQRDQSPSSNRLREDSSDHSDDDEPADWNDTFGHYSLSSINSRHSERPQTPRQSTPPLNPIPESHAVFEPIESDTVEVHDPVAADFAASFNTVVPKLRRSIPAAQQQLWHNNQQQSYLSQQRLNQNRRNARRRHSYWVPVDPLPGGRNTTENHRRTRSNAGDAPTAADLLSISSAPPVSRQTFS